MKKPFLGGLLVLDVTSGPALLISHQSVLSGAVMRDSACSKVGDVWRWLSRRWVSGDLGFQGTRISDFLLSRKLFLRDREGMRAADTTLGLLTSDLFLYHPSQSSSLLLISGRHPQEGPGLTKAD